MTSTENKVKRSPGRPFSKDPSKLISVNLTIEVLEMIEAIKMRTKKDRTQIIEELVKNEAKNKLLKIKK